MRRQYKSVSGWVFDIFNIVLMVLLAFCFLYPFWEQLVLSFSAPVGANRSGLKLWPVEFAISSYQQVFKSGQIWTSYSNTLFRTIIGTVLTVFVTFCGSFVLCRKDLPGRGFIMGAILFTMFFSGGMIPSYLLIRNLGLMGSRWALILPMATSAWNLIMCRNFISALPDSMEEAALIDGAGPFTIAFRVFFPLSMPIVSVLTLWTAVGHWNAWFDALLYTRSNDMMVLQLYLRSLLIEPIAGGIGGDVLNASTAATTPETVKGATIIVSILPIVCLYPFLQKYFVKGVMVGALKG